MGKPLSSEEWLKRYLKKGENVYTICRHVSRSGMLRHISFYIMRDNQPYCIDGNVAKVMGLKFNKHHNALKLAVVVWIWDIILCIIYLWRYLMTAIIQLKIGGYKLTPQIKKETRLMLSLFFIWDCKCSCYFMLEPLLKYSNLQFVFAQAIPLH